MPIVSSELWRKGVHFSGVFFLPVLLWRRDYFLSLVGFFLLVYLFVETSARYGLRIPLFTTLTEKSKRPSEKHRLSQGALFLVTAAILTPLLFGPTAAAFGLAQIFIADTTSSLMGMTLKTKALPFSPKKTWGGTLTFWLTAFLVGLYFVPWPQALALGLLGAVMESLPIPEADNLTVPLTVGAAAYFIGV